VALRHVAKLAGWGALSLAIPVSLASVIGRRGAWLGVGLALLANLWVVLWLPRSAHRAFEVGRFKRAGRRYRLVGIFSFNTRRERAATLSRAGCRIAAGDLTGGEAILSAIDPAALDTSERVVWLNNRACALLDAQGDATRVLELVEEATRLRPDVPAVQHTRARALLAIGRIDDAITVLDSMRTGGELPPRLEAERCRELALAWERKGQGDYADDYRNRARLHAAS
jgi:predicted Zn-dependent protease